MHALHHPRQLLLLLLPAPQLRRDGEIWLCLSAAPRVHGTALTERLPAHRLRQNARTHARTHVRTATTRHASPATVPEVRVLSSFANLTITCIMLHLKIIISIIVSSSIVIVVIINHHYWLLCTVLFYTMNYIDVCKCNVNYFKIII